MLQVVKRTECHQTRRPCFWALSDRQPETGRGGVERRVCCCCHRQTHTQTPLPGCCHSVTVNYCPPPNHFRGTLPALSCPTEASVSPALASPPLECPTDRYCWKIELKKDAIDLNIAPRYSHMALRLYQNMDLLYRKVQCAGCPLPSRDTGGRTNVPKYLLLDHKFKLIITHVPYL